MKLSESDKEFIINEYSNAYSKYGYSTNSVLWGIPEKQIIRFDALTRFLDLSNSTILDIGCGFGDLSKYLRHRFQNVKYIGIDINIDLINQAKELYEDEDTKFIIGDYGDLPDIECDFALVSGTFNVEYKESDRYKLVDSYIKKAMENSRKGISFNFLSNRVNFFEEGLSYYDPTIILDMGYKYSRNLILTNNYLPFDFTITVFKDDSFDDKVIFNRQIITNSY